MSSVVIAGDTSGSVTLAAPSVAGTTTLTLPSTSGTVVTTATSTGVSGSAISTGTVGVAYGGTGANSLTANNVLLGNGTSALQVVAPSTNGNVLTSNGTTWVSSAPPSSTPTTAQVLSATAGASGGAVGTYALCSNNTGSNSIGGTRSGSDLNPSSADWSSTGGTLSGTWRCMGNSNNTGSGANRVTAWLRIS